MKLKHSSVFLFLLAIAVTGCQLHSKENTTDTKPRIVPVSPVIEMDTIIYNEYIADIQAQKNVEVRSRLSGFLEKLYVEEGAVVKEGQLLFKINDEEYHSDLNKAEAILNNALADAKTVELEKERTALLVKNNIVSKTELDVAIAKVNAAHSRIAEARSGLRYAKSRLSHTLIKAPFSGVVDRIPLKSGSLLEEGSLLTSISDLSSINVYFSISEKEYLSMAQSEGYSNKGFKKPVKLTLADGSVYPHEGIARFAESEFAANTGSLSLKAAFPNPNGLLKHGATGKISVPVETGEILVVHQKSVFEIQDKTYVYLVDENNTLKMRPFTAGQRVGHYYIVNAGLSKADKIVFEGTQSLRDGMIIEPKAVEAVTTSTLAQN